MKIRSCMYASSTCILQDLRCKCSYLCAVTCHDVSAILDRFVSQVMPMIDPRIQAKSVKPAGGIMKCSDVATAAVRPIVANAKSTVAMCECLRQLYQIGYGHTGTIYKVG